MANEIKAHLQATRTGSTDIQARVLDADGVQVGALITLTESGSITALFLGDFPIIAAGTYTVRVEDTAAGDLLGVGLIEWDGSAEVVQGFTATRAAELAEVLDHLKNRLEVDFTTTPRQLVLYERDGTTEAHRWNLRTEGGEVVQAQLGMQTKRGAPA